MGSPSVATAILEPSANSSACPWLESHRRLMSSGGHEIFSAGHIHALAQVLWAGAMALRPYV